MARKSAMEALARECARNLERRRPAGEGSEELAELAEALDCDAPASVEPLLALGVTAETAAAFAALPLVEVAWADGAVGEEERWRLLEAAARLGMELGSPSHAQLECWLAERPPAALFDAWHELARTAPGWGGLLRAAERVADAAGGWLGWGRVSRAERRVLARIRAVLAAPAQRCAARTSASGRASCSHSVARSNR
jgi:hypothetical protein